MTDILNPRGRILKVVEEPFLDDDELHENLVASIGLATTDQLLAFLSKGSDVEHHVTPSSSAYFDNPVLELWLRDQLVGTCILKLSRGFSSDFVEIEEGEEPEVYYHVELKRIDVDSDLQRLGLGRHLAIAAGNYAGTVIVEHLLENHSPKAEIVFYADFVSQGGARLFDYLTHHAESITDAAAPIIKIEFSYEYEAGF